MTDSRNSSLFGNNEETYIRQRQSEAYDPFAQAMPVSGEPLFPASLVFHNDAWNEADAQEATGEVAGETIEETPEDTAEAVVAVDEQPQVADYNRWYVMPATDIDTPEVTPDTSSDIGPDMLVAEASHANAQSYAPVYEAASHEVAQSSQREMPAASPKPVLNERDLLFNRHFAVLMDLMQHGAWPQAVEKILALRTEFPEAEALDALLDEATLKADLMTQWAHKIKGRRLTVGQEWIIRRSLPFFLLLALFISGAVFYQTFLAPSRQVVAMERQNQALVEEATGLLQVGQIDQAIELYDLILSHNPDYQAAQQGLAEASRLSSLAVTYDLAIRVANTGNLERSLLMLQSIKATSPAFRDIDARITRVTSLLDAQESYQRAERAFAQRRWIDAITYYEETRLIAADYEAARLGVRLSTAYFLAAQKVMTQWPSAQFGTEQIRDFLRVAQAINEQDNGQDATIDLFLSQLDAFMKGERAVRNNLAQAVELWRELYDQQPDFLGGYLAEQLYRANLALAAEIRTDDPDYARELYTLAATMPVHDSSEARSQLQSLGATIPVAQPTPTPRPTVAYFAPIAADVVAGAAVDVAAAPAEPAATATPEATATPANSFQGWIVFRSTRTGVEEIYIMRGDGSEQQLAPQELRSQIDMLYHQERRGADGREVTVQSATGRSDANLYMASSDGINVNLLTDHNTDEYDPAWSPAAARIVFVANQTGNDEIWSMREDGSDQRQFTFNEWEWDKHPTWSPDGNQIAFFSNRSGQRQIWAMAADGSNQRSLSNNSYDDWDPVWIK
jgi:tetratricopeptide (TPR) repeat protein